MCIEPTTATLIAGIVSAVVATASTSMGIVAANQQSKSQQAMYNYQAKVAKENKEIAEQNAATERQQGIEEERLQRYKTIQKVGAQQAAMAANGIDVTQGTALDVIEDTSTMGELDALQTRYNYERRAQAYEAEAGNFQNQANMDIISAKNANYAGKLNSISNGLAGMGNMLSVADKWYGFSGGGDKTKNNISGSALNQGKYNSIFTNGINDYVYSY